MNKLHLIACQVSGNTIEVKAFENNLLHSCVYPGGIPQFEGYFRKWVSFCSKKIDPLQHNEIVVVNFFYHCVILERVIVRLILKDVPCLLYLLIMPV